MRSKDTEIASVNLPRCLMGGVKVDKSSISIAVWINGGDIRWHASSRGVEFAQLSTNLRTLHNVKEHWNRR